MEAVEIAKGVFWVGALDWNGRNFHGYNTPRGTSYNAYLLTGEKNVLIDTVKRPFYDQLLARISSVIDPKTIELIISNHAEPDHSSSLPLIQRLTGAKILCSKKGVDGLNAHYQDLQLEAVEDGQILQFGGRSYRFIETPFLHWPDSMFTFLEGEKILFSMDGFGQHLCSSKRFDDEVDEGLLMYEASKYYANIVLPFGNQVARAYERIKPLEPRMLATAHGIIWRSKIDKIVAKYLFWAQYQSREKVVIVYDTMWNSTRIMAERIAEAITSQGVEVKSWRMTCTDRATVMEDILEARAVIIGSPTLNGGTFPTVADLSTYLRGLRTKGKVGGVFGSYGWGGGALKPLKENLAGGGIEVAFEDLEVKYVPKQADLDRCWEYGIKIAWKVKGLA